MATPNVTADIVTDLIRNAIEHRTAVLIDEESGDLAARVRKRVALEVDRIALSVLSHYDIVQRRDEIVITVRKLPDIENPDGEKT